jgi:hypothetical protein
MRSIRSSCRAAVLVSAAAITFVAGSSPAALAAGPHHGHQPTMTHYAFRAISYGTRVRGGDLPASSGTTSYQGIGCTNQLGRNKTNDLATITLPGLGRLEGVTAATGTTGSADDVASYSTHDIARLTVAQSALGSLTIRAISASSRATHDASGYHATTDISVGRITLDTPTGPALDLPIPKPGTPVEIPGLLSISIGKEKRVTGGSGSIAKAEGLVIQVLPTHTKIQVAHTAAKLTTGIKRGLFYGKADATQVSAVAGLVHSGPQPLQVMPCQGTRGETRTKSLAALDLAGQVKVGAASTEVMGQQTGQDAYGYTQSSVAHLDLGNGQLVVDGIVGRANVSRSRGKISVSSQGTRVGSVSVNGQPYNLEGLSTLEIPGLVKVESDVVDEKKAGIDVVALRLTLLDGTGAVIDLGHAFLNVAPSGLQR